MTLVATAGTAFAQEEAPAYDLDTVGTTADHAIQSGNLLWIIIGAALVIFMQAGFAMVETGFCRAKHAAHVVTTNLAIFGLGFVGVLPHRLPADVRRLQLPPGYDFGFDDALRRQSLIGCGDWIFAW